jgi:hypothetical protein
MIISFFTLSLRNEIDFVRRSDFIFILRLVWALALKCFSLWFFLRFLSSSFSCFFFINCRFDHREIIISHYFFSLTITMRWSWNDRRRERENCWKEEKKNRLNCVVSCVCLWIEKRMRIAKILRAVIEFRSKKRKLDVVFNDSKFDRFILMIMICFIDLF